MDCGGLHIFREISLVLSEVIVSVLLTLRIYAIYGCNKRVLGFMVLVAAILIGLALQFRSHLWAAIRIWIISLKEAAAWEALFVYDSLLFAMIIIKGYKNKRSMERMPLLHMILRDGAIYFAVMALANLANIFTFYFAGVREASTLIAAKIKMFSFSALYKGGLSTFSSATSVTMISRLTLNLRANTKVQGNLQTFDNVYFSTLHFEPGQGEGHPSTSHEQSVSSQVPNVHCAGIHLEGMRFEHSQIERTVFHQSMMDEDPAMKIAP
ncbi:hypothetical protein D9758_007966 [Tetrapyrgos nigripes]|uniref:Uncharacterized protein n=1 Tax=Tetrapyrgos nigripes TaxID=182062 RepID=A0A8H5D4K9_9AGAR|nr:hypothetical protein D9758_007966 [Tetrapyrgos nigripes]